MTRGVSGSHRVLVGWRERVAGRPLTTFFCAVYALSAIALAVIGVPTLHGERHSGAALVIFPLMVVGVGGIGVGMTR